MKFRRFLISVSAMATVATLAIAPTSAQSTVVKYTEGTDAASAFFDPLKVTRIDLTSTAVDNGRSYNPAQITITMGTKRLGPYNVGIHIKGGWGSTRGLDGKAGFKVKVDYVNPSATAAEKAKQKNQSILGLTKLTLNNMVQDPSMLHEAVAYRLFRAMGVPAPRVGYANVYLNGNNYGLHATIETMDNVSMKRWFKSTKHIFEGSYFPDVFSNVCVSKLSDPANCDHGMSIDTGSKTKTEDLDKLILINQLDGAAWYQQMSTWTDMKELTAFWATELYVGHWDGYVNNRNNYYLHSDSNGKFAMMPWGSDQTFGWEVDLMNYGGNGIMFQKCMQSIPCRSMYSAAVLEAWTKAQTLGLPAMVDNVAAAIEPSMQADPRKEYGADSVHGTQSQTKQFLANRVSYGMELARSYALVSPTIKASVAKGVVTVTWAGAKVYGITQQRYTLQKSTDNVNWTNVTSGLALSAKVSNIARGTTVYFRTFLTTSQGDTPYSKVISVRVP